MEKDGRKERAALGAHSGEARRGTVGSDLGHLRKILSIVSFYVNKNILNINTISIVIGKASSGIDGNHGCK
jgi:hypothetical protein